MSALTKLSVSGCLTSWSSGQPASFRPHLVHHEPVDPGPANQACPPRAAERTRGVECLWLFDSQASRAAPSKLAAAKGADSLAAHPLAWWSPPWRRSFATSCDWLVASGGHCRDIIGLVSGLRRRKFPPRSAERTRNNECPWLSDKDSAL